MSTPLQEIERLGGWFRNVATPLWAKAAWDDAHGGFFEALDFSGAPIRGPRRVRVQSRQVYTFSMIGARGWHPEAESIAANGFDFLFARACPDDGDRGCIHILSDDGDTLDNTRDLYDQAFLLLACAARIETAMCNRAKALAEKTVAFLDRELASPHGGWLENDKGDLPRRQNPHMHLFEAFTALYRATGETVWREKANKVADLFDRYFFDAKTGTLTEFFTDTLTESATANGATIEPGHMMEWVWLLGQHEKLTGVDHRADMQNLYAAAIKNVDGASGFLPDSVQANHGRDADSARRLWPQTEYIKAAFTHSTSINDSYAQDGASIINAVCSTYLDHPVAGLWCDQFTSTGAPLAVDVPASILYHLFEAVAATQDYAQKMGQS